MEGVSTLKDFSDYGSNTFRKYINVNSEKSFKVRIKNVVLGDKDTKELLVKVEIINNNNEMKEIINLKRGKTFKFQKLKYPGELSITLYDPKDIGKKLDIKDFEVMVY